MKPEELFAIWAPIESIWSPWVVPVPFAQLVCGKVAPSETGMALAESLWLPTGVEASRVIVVDLPGPQVIGYGLALARMGMRPVPVIDGSPGPGDTFFLSALREDSTALPKLRNTVVDMSELLRGLCRGGDVLPALQLRADAPPAFLLDSLRTNDHRPPPPELFDNRWKTFPQDFPSARLLLERGIRFVLIIQEGTGQPCEDLLHVVLRWHEAGIVIQSKGLLDDAPPQAIRPARPSHFRSGWHRTLAMLGLHRGEFGGFGNWPHGSGG
jgi:hypothetical protein